MHKIGTQICLLSTTLWLKKEKKKKKKKKYYAKCEMCKKHDAKCVMCNPTFRFIGYVLYKTNNSDLI